MRMRFFLRLLFFVSLLCVPAGANSRFYAIVVGVDSYSHITPLHGAVNDAEMMAGSLRSAGAFEVKLLVNEQATRLNIMDGFHQLVAMAKPNDWVVFSYAGHGWQEPEQTKPFRHPDGKNNAILLTGFEPVAPGANERIRDFEIAEMLAEVPPDVRVLFIADACHSGTLTREVDPRAKGLTYRNTPYGPIVNDELPPEPKDTALTTDEQPNVVFAAAALDTETAPELVIGGKSHGALSWYVAKAIDGEADLNQDGVTTLAEFRSYVTASVRAAAESRQTPDVRYVAGRSDEVLPFLRSAPKPSPQPMPDSDKGQSAQPDMNATVSVAVVGGDPALLKGFPGIVSACETEADLLWDVGKGEVVNRRLADPVAQDVKSAAGFAGVADKWRALPVLYGLSAKSPMMVHVGPDGSGKRYAAGSVVSLGADTPDGKTLPYITAFNLAGNGNVELQFPATLKEAGVLPPDFKLEFSSKVQPPFGADHLVVVATAEEPVTLRMALRALANKPAAGDAMRAVVEATRNHPYAIGIAQLYTGP
jgi:hypothetical protein